MKNILVDTGFWLAINNTNDKHHKNAMSWLMNNQSKDYRFATTWVVMCESFFLIKNFVGYKKAVALFESYSRTEYDIYDLEKESIQRVIDLMKKYEDMDVDLADVSLVLLAEKLDTGDILTVDRNDFTALRWKKNKRFKQLLF